MFEHAIVLDANLSGLANVARESKTLLPYGTRVSGCGVRRIFDVALDGDDPQRMEAAMKVQVGTADAFLRHAIITRAMALFPKLTVEKPLDSVDAAVSFIRCNDVLDEVLSGDCQVIVGPETFGVPGIDKVPREVLGVPVFVEDAIVVGLINAKPQPAVPKGVVLVIHRFAILLRTNILTVCFKKKDRILRINDEWRATFNRKLGYVIRAE